MAIWWNSLSKGSCRYLRCVSAALLVGVVAACSQEASQSIKVEPVDEIRVMGDIELRITVADSHGVSVSGSPASLDAIVVAVQSERLTLSSRDYPLLAEVTLPAIAAVELFNSARADLQEIQSAQHLLLAAYADAQLHIGSVAVRELDVRASGSAQIALDAIVADELVLLSSGNSAVALAGSVERSHMNIAGNAVVAAREFRVQSLELSADGNSTVSVWATAHIGGNVSGRADVTVRGAPDLAVQETDDAVFELSGDQY